MELRTDTILRDLAREPFASPFEALLRPLIVRIVERTLAVLDERGRIASLYAGLDRGDCPRCAANICSECGEAYECAACREAAEP